VKETVTFLVVSNRKGNTRKVTVPVSTLRAFAVSGVIALIILAAGLLDYMGLLGQSIENKKLRADNSLLKNQFQAVEGKVQTLEARLERVNSFVTKLKLITDIGPERSLQLAMGPVPKPGQQMDDFNEPVSDREVASISRKEEVFTKEPALAIEKDELAAEANRDFAMLSVRVDKLVTETNMREQGVLELWETLSERQSLMNATPSIRPVNGWFTSKFGYRLSPFSGLPMMHQGADIAASPGAPVYVPADGIVSYVGYDSGYGNLISIDHGYGVVTRYGHNSRVYVTVGQKVKRRDIIAAVGNTGRSTGPHLHYEVRVNGIPMDPTNYVLDE
jgi:murein DD-endopeptidase MepM/ murein hydrolase activator NlpD